MSQNVLKHKPETVKWIFLGLQCKMTIISKKIPWMNTSFKYFLRNEKKQQISKSIMKKTQKY